MARAKKKWKLFSRERGHHESSTPGNFAAVTTQKIAGRLDCHSGKRAKRENRIFLRYLEDMPTGFRPCKICKPDVLRVGDRLSTREDRAKEFRKKPHVQVGWSFEDLFRKDRRGRSHAVLLCWPGWAHWGSDWTWHCRISPSGNYQKTRALALKEGKRLNLPVIKVTDGEIVILSLPATLSTRAQKRAVKDIMNRNPAPTVDLRRQIPIV